MYTLDFEHKIAGIPCTIVANIPDHPEDEYVYTVYARGKKPARWLEAKIDDETHDEILNLIREEARPVEDDYYENNREHPFFQ